MRANNLLKLSRNLPMVVPWGGTAQRNQVREENHRDAASSESTDASNQEPPPNAALFRRQRLSVKPNITEGEKRAGKLAS
ncbi:hypothetical protein MRX96_017982 [Rhipicephalus microplus]